MIKAILIVLALSPVSAEAGWLLWEAPAYIPAPPDEKEIRSVEEAPLCLPPNALLSGKPGTELELDAVFEGEAGRLRDFLGGAGFEETPYGFKGSFFAALTQLFSARFPTRFPPAPKWVAAGRPQDFSFLRLRAGGREGVYLWRLSCRTKKAPLWAAGETASGGKSIWAELRGKAQKSRALKIKARLTGKNLELFTLP